MMYKMNIFRVAGFCLILAACVSKGKQELRLSGQAQGSTYTITYFDDKSRNFQVDIDSIFEVIDRSMSLWREESLISRLNRGETIQPDEHLREVINKSILLYHMTYGNFDPSVGPLVRIWKIDSRNQDQIPNDFEIGKALENTGFDKIIPFFSGEYFQLPDTTWYLDLNAIAQGYTVDVIAEFLEGKGVSDYMIEVGGEIRTKGLNKYNKPWRIGIDKPIDNPDGRPLQVILNLSGQSLATSGSYRKFRMIDGQRYSHAIDASTGYPVTHNLLSVSVIAEECAIADALATAFLVMGVEQSLRWLEESPYQAYFISDDGKGGFQIDMTSGFKPYILDDVFK